MSLPGVDIVVPTFRRPEALQRCLEALRRQTVAPASITVIDDSETDRGPAWARNQGWRQGTAPVVAFTDDDCVPAPDWVERTAEAFRDPATAAIEGSLLAPGPHGRLQPYDPAPHVRWDRFRTANMAYRRSLLEQVGGFDERYRIHREDTDLAWRVAHAGHRIAWHPEVQVAHPDRPGAERHVTDNEVRLYRLDPAKYAECFAGVLNRTAWRSGRGPRLRATLAGTPAAPDLAPLSRAEWRRLWIAALRLAWKWRRAGRRARRGQAGS